MKEGKGKDGEKESEEGRSTEREKGTKERRIARTKTRSEQ